MSQIELLLMLFAALQWLLVIFVRESLERKIKIQQMVIDNLVREVFKKK